MTELGETSTAVGLTAEYLKTMADNGALTNGIVTELSSSRLKELAQVLSVPEMSMKSRISAVKKKIAGLKRSINRDGVRAQLQSFMAEAFVLPVKFNPKRKELKEAPTCQSCSDLLEANNTTQQRYKEKLAQMEAMHEGKINVLEASIKDLKTKRRLEKKKLQERNQKLALRLNSVYDAIGCRTERKHILRKIRRLKFSSTRWRQNYQTVNRKYEHLKNLSKKRQKNERNFRLRISRACRKEQRSSSTRSQAGQQRVAANEPLFVSELIQENDTLQDKLDNITQPIQTREGRQFAPAIREVSYYLQEQGVAESRVGEVIRTVCETVVGRRVGKLPSTSTQRRLAAEMKSLSRIQVTDALRDEENLTLKYDGTTKRNLGHLAEVEISTGNDTYMMGMKQQPGGLASDYVETITQCADNKLGKCTNTMTDRCVTNAAVDAQLEEKVGRSLNKFRCAMHPLDAFAKKADAILKSLDKERVVPNDHRGESRAQALIRTADDVFNNAATGDIAGLKTFLYDQGYKSSFPSWMGNRFNILFRSAAILSRVGEGIMEYFEKVSEATNELHKAFSNAWTTEAQTDLRCLGIIHHMITGPWMHIVGKQKGILDINVKYNDALVYIEECQKDTALIFQSDVTAFREKITDVQSWKEISKDPTPEMHTTLAYLLEGLHEVMKRQLASQLPEGEFWDPSDELQVEAQSCAPTNISGERNFALLDSRLHRAPNATISKLEGKVMFSVNKTRQWLEASSPQMKREFIEEAVTGSKKTRSEDRAESKAYKEAIRNRVRSKREKLTEKNAKERERVEDMMESVITHGVITPDNMVEKLENMSKTRACNILRKQITFRTKVLKQHVEKVAFSKCSKEKLQTILCSFPQDVEDHPLFVSFIIDPSSILQQEFNHRRDADGRDIWYRGRAVAVDSGEFKIHYDDQDEPFFMTQSELLTDLYLQALVMV